MDKFFSGEEIEEWRSTNKEVDALAKEFERIFRDHFYLSETEIHEKIEEIFSRGELEVAEKIFMVFDKFIEIEDGDDLKKLSLMGIEQGERTLYRSTIFAKTAIDKVL